MFEAVPRTLTARTATQVSDCRQTPQRQIADDVAQQRRGEPFCFVNVSGGFPTMWNSRGEVAS